MSKILIVDDDFHFRDAVRVMLASLGHEALEASEGAEGIRIFQGHPDAIVLCDIFMSGKEGFETIRDLRRDFPASRIVAMSGGDFKGRMDVFKIAMLMGASATLRKPFNQDQLSAVLIKLAVPSDID